MVSDPFLDYYGPARIRKITPSGLITTIAGNGSLFYNGDGIPATSAGLNTPSGLVVDAQGNLYIADSEHSRIRKIDTNGIITTVAGNGQQASYGDGGRATNAGLYYPVGVAVDKQGNIYISDSVINSIRRVDKATGIISTIAGSLDGFSGDGKPASAALLSVPTTLLFDAQGNLLIADTGNHRIRRINTSGIINTLVGKSSSDNQGNGDGGPATSAYLVEPIGMALDARGNLYITDRYDNRIRKVSPDGIITTLAGSSLAGYSGDGGPAKSATLNAPLGIAVNAQGNLIFGDTKNYRVRQITLAVPEPVLTSGAIYRIQVRHSGKALDVYGASEADGGRVVQWPSNNQVNQQWQLTALDNGYYSLKCVNSGKLLEVYAFQNQDGAQVNQWTSHGGYNQQFKPIPTGDGYYYLQARHSQKYLDIDANSQKNGAFLQQWSKTGGANQQFLFSPVSSPKARSGGHELESLSPLELVVYPNPARDQLRVDGAVGGVVRLLDGLGRIRAQGVIGQGGWDLNVSAFGPGVYGVQLQTGQRVITRKVVIAN